MVPLIVLLIALVLLAAFFALTSYETSRGTRLFGGVRGRFDGKVEHALFIYEHVDLNAFVHDEAQAFLLRLSHFLAHFSLQSVRFVERELTRAVRYLRARVASEIAPARPTERPFVQALGDFKEELKQTRPSAPPEF
jgi:hypothetical protein